MEFHIPVFVWVMLFFAAVGWIARLWLNRSTRETLTKAEALTGAAAWQQAAVLYKQVLNERTDDHGILSDIVKKLSQLYQANAVEADLSELNTALGVLGEIDSSSVSDRNKAQLKRELCGKWAKVVSALPPATVAADDEPVGIPTAVETNCRYCSKPIAGRAWKFSDYTMNPALKRDTSIGHVCPACGAVSHTACASGIRFSGWSGYEKSHCAACGARVDSPTMIFPAHEAS